MLMRRQPTATGADHRTPGAGGPTSSAVRLESVTRIYGTGDNSVTALRDVSVTFPKGTFTAVMGPSGSGKSTFLHCAAGLDRPTSGQVYIGDVRLGGLNPTELTELRRDRVGFVFQAFNLVPALNAWQNILLPLRLSGRPLEDTWARELVERIGMSDRVMHRPAELSGGQQQRVAITRALVTRPDVVFADEPTGNLDSHTSEEILELLRHAVDEYGQTVVMVTHDPRAAAWADSAVFLLDGRVHATVEAPTAESLADRMGRLEE